jgi:tRNA (guanine-N7-)-methyltransferase
MARMRKKKNIPERMQACASYWFPVPVANRGRWREMCGVAADVALYLEIGCGKGTFAIETVKANPDICYIAMEKDESVILSAIEKAAENQVNNLFFLHGDATLVTNYFNEHEIDRIYINFCDPWSKKNKPKRRLTYRGFLESYKKLMKPDGAIFFKTDDKRLFEFSLEEFEAASFQLSAVTYDLHSSEWNEINIRTEFESRFAELGKKIMRLQASL